MPHMRTQALVFLLMLAALGVRSRPSRLEAQQLERSDGAKQLTCSPAGTSAQNPAFSPDGQYVLFTRFLGGYNTPPAELVTVNWRTGEETVIVPAQPDVEHINAPGTAWVDGQICWSSDQAGASNEIFTAHADGTHTTPITHHPEAAGYYIEPVFDPQNSAKIAFEFGPSDDAPHHIALVERDKNNKVTLLTNDPRFDDRLPNWSHDGQRIVFQRTASGEEAWQVWVATVDFSGPAPVLVDAGPIAQPNTANTDNAWYSDDAYILSSTDYRSAVPNIFLLPVQGGEPIRVTRSATHEDGAPTSSPDGHWVAFESHLGEDEEYPSEIWLIPVEPPTP